MQGRYTFKLLAVDVPTAAGAEQRLFVYGDDKLYMRGGVMSELRDPFMRVGCLMLNLFTTNMTYHKVVLNVTMQPGDWQCLAGNLHATYL